MIRIAFGPQGAAEAASQGSKAIAVVVDALRSSATLTAMLKAGAEAIYVCADVPTARAVAAKLEGALLAGESNTVTPEGFDLGNSPVAIARTDIAGREVVFTSSNGAPILVACRGAARIVMGGLNNAAAVAKAVFAAQAEGRDAIIIPAGELGVECDEDTAAAVLLAEVAGPDIDPAQEGLMARWRAAVAAEGLQKLFAESLHGKALIDKGFGEDIAAAAAPDTASTLPDVAEFLDFDGTTVALVRDGS